MLKDGLVTILPERPDTAVAVALIDELEAYLDPLYPSASRHGYSVEKLVSQNVAFFVLRYQNVPAGCGGIQLFGKEYGELKRIFVRPQFRGKGFSKVIMQHLEAYALEQGVPLLRLETGIYQAEAIGFKDNLIYKEMNLDPEDRALSFHRVTHPEAEGLFREWSEKQDKMPY